MAAPSTIKGGSFVDIRFALMIGLLIFAGLRPRLSARGGALAATLFAAVVGTRSVYVSSTWWDHRHDLADLGAAIAAVPPGAKVLAARGRPGHLTDVEPAERALPGMYRLDGHLAGLLVIERRAFWPLLFADPAQQPLQVQPAYRDIAPRNGEPVDWRLLLIDDATAPDYLKNWRRNFDDVLLIDPQLPLDPPPGLTVAYAGPYAVLFRIAP